MGVLLGAFGTGRAFNIPPSAVPLLEDGGDFLVAFDCKEKNVSSDVDFKYGLNAIPAVYVVSTENLPDPFGFYVIAPEVRSSVHHLVKQGVLSESGLDEIGKRRHALGLLDLLDVNDDWTISSTDFEYLQRHSHPVGGSSTPKISYVSSGFLLR